MIKSLVNIIRGNKNSDHVSAVDIHIDKIVQEATQGRSGWYTIKLSDLPSYTKLKEKDAAYKKQVLFAAIDGIIDFDKNSYKRSYYDNFYKKRQVYETLMTQLLRSDLKFEEKDIHTIYEKFSMRIKQGYFYFLRWPIGLFLSQVRNFVNQQGLSDSLTSFLENLKKSKGLNAYGIGKESELKCKIDEILNFGKSKNDPISLITLDERDAFGKLLNAFLQEVEVDAKKHWNDLFILASTSNTAKPSKRFLNQAKKIIEDIGEDIYTNKLREWLTYLVHLKTAETIHPTKRGNYSTYDYLFDLSLKIAKGLVWTSTIVDASGFASLLAQLTERSFKKIPGVGPTAMALGNACIYALAQAKEIESISHLSRLQLRMQQNNTKRLIEKYITEAAHRFGITKEEIEDLAVPAFGLKDGILSSNLDTFTAQIEITGIGKTKTVWLKEDGKIQKSVPAQVKKNHPEALKNLSRTAKEIQKNLTAQRDRLDRSYLSGRTWAYPKFREYYLEHGLMSFLTKKLIWSFKKDQHQIDGIWLNNEWVDRWEQPIEWIDENTSVKLWHPITEGVETVTGWRKFLDTHGIKQPMKQAYREIYLLTDAERNTRTYSNRMAAHLLKQHQFNSLAKIRGWNYSLMGAYDDGRYNEVASIKIPNHGLVAEFWVNEVVDDHAFNDAGIWDYVATDQVRFLSESPRDVITLENVPPLILSEVMRDVDLFVGVGSVGNDPTWQDSGGTIRDRYSDYWQSYSFGNLNETSKIRKEVLENLIPRLKIRDKCTINGNFLIVNGKLRTYKIHIGSTNILMEPNDSYLCIVVDRSAKTNNNVFLPFEGDRQLSVILSKALLLAEDDKITDRTIVSQIKNRR